VCLNRPPSTKRHFREQNGMGDVLAKKKSRWGRAGKKGNRKEKNLRARKGRKSVCFEYILTHERVGVEINRGRASKATKGATREVLRVSQKEKKTGGKERLPRGDEQCRVHREDRKG